MAADPIPYNTAKIILYAINAAFGCIFLGYNFTIFNPAQSYISQVVYPDISKHVLYLMTSFTPFGAAFGSIVAGKLAALYGRRNSMIWTDVFSIICVGLTLIKNEYILLIGRLLVGVNIGLNASLATIYLAEVSPAQLRGITCALNPAFFNLGIVIAYLFGLNIPTGDDASSSQWWRVMFGFSGIISLIRLLNFIFFIHSETPKYLVTIGKDDQAKEALSHFYYQEEDIQIELELLQKELRRGELTELTGRVAYRDLWSPHYKQRFIIACLLLFAHQFSGGNAILLYSTEIFRQANMVDSQFTPEFYTVIIGVLSLLASILVNILIASTGRRTLLLNGGTALFISLSLVGLSGLLAGGYNVISVLFVYTSIASWSLSFGTVVWVYLPEILPDIGVGLAQSLNWIGCFIMAQGVPYLIDIIGDSWTFLLFAGICLISIFFIFKYVKETKDKNGLEIAEMYSVKVSNDNEEEQRLKDE